MMTQYECCIIKSLSKQLDALESGLIECGSIAETLAEFTQSAGADKVTTDYLLRFDSKLDFDAVAEVNGLSTVDPTTGEPTPTLATYTYAQVIIGEHFIPTGNTIPGPDGLPVPELAGDGFHWVLFRELESIPAISALSPYAQWASSFVDAAGDPVPRPAGPDFPQTTWL